MSDDGLSFALAMSTAVVLPWTLMKVRATLRPSEAAKWRALGFSPTSPIVCKETAASAIIGGLLTWQNALYGVLLAGEALMLKEALAEPPVIPPFDPYAALELDATVEGCRQGRLNQWGEVRCQREVIKAAYRRLARENHPDKVGDDVGARMRFDQIVKAHAVLTDPVAASNYRKYGNPDGYQGFQFGIALPSWLMGEGAFLACFLVVVIVVPALFFLCLRDPAKARQQRLSQRAQEVYTLAALGMHDQMGGAGGIDAAMERLTDPRGGRVTLQPRCVSPAALPSLVHLAAAAEEEHGGGGGGGGGGGSASGAQRALAAHLERAVPPSTRDASERQAALAELPAVLEGFFQASLSLSSQRLLFRDGALPVLRLTQRLNQAMGDADVEVMQVPHVTRDRAAAMVRRGAAVASGSAGVDHASKAGGGTATNQGAEDEGTAEEAAEDAAAATTATTSGAEGTVGAKCGDAKRAGGGAKAAKSRSMKGGKQDKPPAIGGRGGDSTVSNAASQPASRDGDAPAPAAGSMAWVMSLSPPERRAALEAAGLNATEVADATAFITRVFPMCKLSVGVEVAGEEDTDDDESGDGDDGPDDGGAITPRRQPSSRQHLVLVGDLVTLNITLIVNHGGGGGGGGGDGEVPNATASWPAACHAPYLPQRKAESWIVVLTEVGGGRVVGMKPAPPMDTWAAARGAAAGRQWTAKLQLMADGAGSRELEAHAICPSYAGADAKARVQYTVREEAPRRNGKTGRKATAAAAKPFGQGAGIGLPGGVRRRPGMGKAEDRAAAGQGAARGGGSSSGSSEDETASDSEEEEDPLAGVDPETRRAILKAQMDNLCCTGED